MPFASHRRASATAAITISLAFAGPAALAAQSAAAATPPSTFNQRGLLDPILGIINGLGGVLSGLLGPAALNNLNLLSAGLGSGATSPTPTSLTPLTTLLNGAASNGSVPVDTQSLIAQVSSLLGAVGAPGQTLPVAYLDPVVDLLGSLAGQQGLSTDQISALTGLASTLSSLIANATPGSAVGGLPLGSLPIDSSQLTGLTGILGLLQGGVAPTGAQLDPIAAVLHQAGNSAGLPAPVAQLINALASQVDGATGLLPTDLVAPVGQLLGSIAATPGVPAQLGSTLSALAALLGSGTAPSGSGSGSGNGSGTSGLPNGTATYTPGSSQAPLGSGAQTATPGAKTTSTPTGSSNAGSAASKYRQPKFSSAKFDRAKSRFVFKFSCPGGGQTCATLVWLTNGSKVVGKAFLAQIAPGYSLTRTVKLDNATKKAMKTKTLRVKVTALTSKTRMSSRTVTIKRVTKKATAKAKK